MAEKQKSGSSNTLVGIAAVVLILAGAWFFVISPMVNSDPDAWRVQMSDDGHYEVTVNPALNPIELNELHEWIVHIAHEDGSPLENAEISITGGMPAHGHGFSNNPQFTGYLGDGNYKIEGVQFHMPGEWVIEIGFSIEDHQHTVEYTLNIDA